MNQNTKISTVIPTFNRKIFVKDTIQSCLNQSIQHEVIICDHGSNDGTDEVVKQFENKVRYIKKIKDNGPHFCWLDGILEAKGELINLLFDDDWIEPRYIEKCIEYFNHPDVGFVFTAAKVYDEDQKKIVSTLHDNFVPNSGIFDISKYEAYLLKYLISPSSLIIRKKDLVDAIFMGKLPFARYTYKGVGPDKFMTLLCMLRYKKFGYVSENLSVYRFHKNSITVDSSLMEEKDLLLKRAYEEINKYYYILKYGKNFSYVQNKYYLFLRNKFNSILNKTLNFFQ